MRARRIRACACTALAVVPLLLAAAARADDRRAADAFLHGRVEAAAFVTELCANVDRRSLAAMCDDDPARVALGLERRRRAHWTALGPDALWAAARRGAITGAFARRMHDECFAGERRSSVRSN